MKGRTGGTPPPLSSQTKGHASNLVMFSLFFVVAELFIWMWCMWQQITTTHDSIFGLIQGGTLVPSHLTAQQVVSFFQSNESKDNAIAYSVALVTQAVFLGCFMPDSPIHNITLKRVVIGIFFVLEVVSDFWYSAATGSTIGGAFMWVLNWDNGGWLASFCYIVAMSAGSTLVGIDAFHRLERLFLRLKTAATANR